MGRCFSTNLVGFPIPLALLDVLTLSIVTKTPEEVKQQQKDFERKKAEKEARKREQEANVERKQAEKEARKAAAQTGQSGEKRKRVSFTNEDDDSDADDEGSAGESDRESGSDHEDEASDAEDGSDVEVSEELDQSDSDEDSEEEVPVKPRRPPPKGRK